MHDSPRDTSHSFVLIFPEEGNKRSEHMNYTLLLRVQHEVTLCILIEQFITWLRILLQGRIADEHLISPWHCVRVHACICMCRCLFLSGGCVCVCLVALARLLLLRLLIIFYMCVPPSFLVCHFCGVILAQQKALYLFLCLSQTFLKS